MTKKPRWVECAEKAGEVLERAEHEKDVAQKEMAINEAHAWMRLADIFRMGPSSESE